MEHNILKIIDNKANKMELSNDELNFVVKSYLEEKITEAQMSSLLMAMKLNGLSINEINELVKIYIDSGEKIEYPNKEIFIADKHSTGGVGDKISLILGPLVASMGVHMGKISGRGLGYTGGTVDKLEAIEKFNVEMDIKTFAEYVIKNKLAIMGQTNLFCPADKKIYDLRNSTSTVNSLGLIVASIMSKKIAANPNSILIDLKSGSGGFFSDKKDEEDFANLVIKIGKEFKIDTRVIVSNMNQPLGNNIGNLNEVDEAIEILRGEGPSDVKELATFQAAIIYTQYNKDIKFDEAKKLASSNLKNNKALEKFVSWIKAQGGKDIAYDKIKLHNPKYTEEIKADKDGYVDIGDCSEFGLLSLELGAGRYKKTDIIDNHAGIKLVKKQNDYVKKGEIIGKLYSSKKKISDHHINKLKGLVTIQEKNPQKNIDVVIKYIK